MYVPLKSRELYRTIPEHELGKSNCQNKNLARAPDTRSIYGLNSLSQSLLVFTQKGGTFFVSFFGVKLVFKYIKKDREEI